MNSRNQANCTAAHGLKITSDNYRILQQQAVEIILVGKTDSVCREKQEILYCKRMYIRRHQSISRRIYIYMKYDETTRHINVEKKLQLLKNHHRIYIYRKREG